MPKTRVQKEQTVADLTAKLGRSKSVVFTDFKGLNMSQITDIRKKLREQDAEFSVTKNTLLERAIKESGLPTPNEDALSGPVATLFSYADEVSPLKTLVKTLKEAQTGKIKGGILDAQFLNDIAITRLANLPGKQELQGKVVGILAAPLTGMVGVLQANLRNLVYALNQIKLQKGGE